MMSYPDMDMRPSERNDNASESFDKIFQCGYKDVQAMAVHRKLPANLKKVDMARLIALHDAGAEAELEHLLSDLRETRHRTRRVQSAHSASSPSSPSSSYRGYVTAEADSANPDLDDDDDLCSPAVEDDGDEDYEPSSKSKRAKKGAERGSGKQQGRRYANTSTPPLPNNAPVAHPGSGLGHGHGQGGHPGGHPAGHPGALPAGHGAGGHPGGLPAGHGPGGHPGGSHGGHVTVGRGGLEEPPKPKKPVYRRPSGNSNRVSKTGRVIKPRHDSSYVYSSKISLSPNTLSYPTAPTPATAYHQGMSVDGSGYDSAQGVGTVGPFRAPVSYVHSPRPSEHQTFSAPSNPNQFYNNYQSSQLPKGPEYPYLSDENSFSSQQGTSTVVPFKAPASHGHSLLHPSAHQTFGASSNSNQFHNNYQSNQLPKESEFAYLPSFGSLQSNPNSSTLHVDSNSNLSTFHTDSSLAEPQLERNYSRPPAAENYDIKPTLYPPMNNSYLHTPMGSAIAPSQVVKPISLPAMPSNDSPTNGYISANLEWFFNVKSENLHMPLQLSAYWKPANTNSVNSYVTPISFTSSGPGLYQEATHTPMKPFYHVNPSYEESAFQPLMKPLQKAFSNYPNLNYDMNQNNVLLPNSQPKPFVPEAHPYPHAPLLYENNQPLQRSPTPYQGPPPLQPLQGPPTPYQGPPPLHGPPTSYQMKTKHMKQQVHQKQVAQQRRRQMQQPQYQSHQTVRQSSLLEHDRRSNSHYQSGSHQHHPLPYKSQHQHAMQQQVPSKGQKSLPSSFQPQQKMANQHQSPYQQQVPYQQPAYQPSTSVLHRQGPAPKKPCYEPNQNTPPQPSQPLQPISGQVPVLEQPVQKPSSSTQEAQRTNAPQLPFPEFRGQNHELSYPLIYDYLTSAEKQLSTLQNSQECAVDTSKCNIAEYSSAEPQVTQSKCVGDNITPSIEDVLPTISRHVLNSKLNELSNASGSVDEKVDSTPTSSTHISAQPSHIPTSPMTVHSTVDEPQGSATFQAQQSPTTDVILTPLESIEPVKVGSTVPECPPELIEPEKSSDLIDKTLEKVVKADENTKQVVFLCSDGMGEFEYMTLSVSQEDGLNASVGSIPGTAPVTPCASDVGNLVDINNNEATLQRDQDLSAMSGPTSSHISQVSTLPVTNSDVSTETSSSLSDYMSSQQTLDRTSSNHDSVDGSNLETATSSGIVIQHALVTEDSELRISDAISLQVRDTTRSLTEEQVPQLEGSISAGEEVPELQKTEDNVVPSCSESLQFRPNADSLESQVPVTLGEVQDISVQDLTVRTVPSGVSFEEKPDNVEEPEASKDTDNIKVIVEIKQENYILMEPLNLMQPVAVEVKEEPCSASTTGSLSEDSNDSCESSDPVLPHNVNVMRQISAECSVVLENVGDLQGEKSPLQTDNDCRTDALHQVSPLLRSKSAGKTYPGKQARQPVRCSPRTSGRAGPSYSLQSAQALALQRAMPLRIESAMQQPAKGRKPCPNAEHGCLLVLPPAQLSSHHLVCEYSYIECPAIGCAWQCIAKKLCTHIREAHRGEIGSGTDSKHTVSIHEIRQQQRLTFLREVSRKLFVVCIHAFGNSIYASIQFIASGRAEKPVSAMGTLEVIDFGGAPHAWRGKIGLIQQPLHIVRNSGNCLQVPSECLGTRVVPDATITFHTNIRVNLSQSQVQSASVSDPLS